MQCFPISWFSDSPTGYFIAKYDWRPMYIGIGGLILLILILILIF